jgi:DNA mismatch endonuclease (patch repair protein)
VVNLPGKPDIVFPSRRRAIFVHGCFWHQHSGCPRATIPVTRRHYWGPKLARTVERDKEHVAALAGQGWASLVIWECDLKRDPEAVLSTARHFILGPPTPLCQ